jgi:hypothetical protein
VFASISASGDVLEEARAFFFLFNTSAAVLNQLVPFA